MKRFVGCSSALALLVWLVAASCSNPLETTPPEEGGNPISSTDTITILDTLQVSDTVVVTDSLCDTIRLCDTVVVTDTLVLVDSVVVMDTVVRVDTVVVRDCDDEEECTKLCDKLNSHHKQITWTLNNEAGRHRLDFSAWPERDKPMQKMYIYAGGKTYTWSPSQGREKTLELDLPEDACIRICLDNPRACGHEIKVCLCWRPI